MSKGSKTKSGAAGDGGVGADEKHHKYRCRELKRQLGELEDYNEALAIKLLRSQKRLRRMKIERNVLLERFERTHRYATNHDDDSASDSDAPLKDTFPRPHRLSDAEANDPSYYAPVSATTATSAASARSRRKLAANNAAASVASTPRQNSTNGIHTDPAAAAPVVSTRKPRVERDPRAPKRPANAFVMFCQFERPSIKSASTDLTSGELTKAMSAKWKDLPKSEKQKYFDLYEREMVRYQQELVSYKEGGTAPPTPASDSAPSKSGQQPSADADDNSALAPSADAPQKQQQHGDDEEPSTASTSTAFSEATTAASMLAYAETAHRAHSQAADADRGSEGDAGSSISTSTSNDNATAPADAEMAPSSQPSLMSVRELAVASQPLGADGDRSAPPRANGVATGHASPPAQASEHLPDPAANNAGAAESPAAAGSAQPSTEEIEKGLRSTALGEGSQAATAAAPPVTAPSTAKVAGQS